MTLVQHLPFGGRSDGWEVLLCGWWNVETSGVLHLTTISERIDYL